MYYPIALLRFNFNLKIFPVAKFTIKSILKQSVKKYILTARREMRKLDLGLSEKYVKIRRNEYICKQNVNKYNKLTEFE
jgi:hypothetical protein